MKNNYYFFIIPKTIGNEKDRIDCDEIFVFDRNLSEIKSRAYNDILSDEANIFIGIDSCRIINYLISNKNQIPKRMIDIGVEARNLRNGIIPDDSPNLSNACKFLKIDQSKSQPEQMMEVYEQLRDIINIDLAFFRGQYLIALAKVERTGIPIDFEKYMKLKENRVSIRKHLIDEFDQEGKFYKNYRFSEEAFTKYICISKLTWPITETGRLDLKKETMIEMANIDPEIKKLVALRKLLKHLQKTNLSIDADGRNRTPLVPFKAKTGRNQPKSSRYIFGQSKVLRNLIKPSPGTALAYIDWSQQEFAIAAALSGDKNMQKAYQDGDPYLYFAKLAEAVPDNATKDSHPEIRKVFKECILATQYGMGARSLAKRINSTISYADYLLQSHRNKFPDYWQWRDNILDIIMTQNKIETCFGWKINITKDSEINERSLSNFLIQATAAEMLRLATIEIVESQIKICTSVFDAFLIESEIDKISSECSRVQKIMEESSLLILESLKILTETDIFTFPNNYSDTDGRELWIRIESFLL